MNAAPDPADERSPSDPALYAPRRVLGPTFWAMIVLCLACVAAGAAIAHFGPTWFARGHAAAPSPAAPAPASALALAAPAAPPPSPVAALPPSPDVGRLEARLALLETGQKSTLDAAAAALAAASLAEAARDGAPFVQSVSALERVLAPSPETRALERLARDGAPTVAGLAASFEAQAGAVAVAARDPGPDAGALARLKHALSRVVTIRRVGTIAGDGPDAILARAQAQLEGGALEPALRTLDALPPSARPVLAAWRADAERRAEIDRLVAAVRDEALAGLVQVSRRQADARLAGAAP